MKIDSKTLRKLATIAENAAVDAGKMIESYISIDPSRASLKVDRKATGSSVAAQVVTEVDLKSERVILDILSPTLDDFDLAMLSEESIDDQSRFQKDYFWCIDPLDGTLAFTEARVGFSVSIALVSKEGIPQIGVVYDPSTQTIYTAIKGQGAVRNKLPITLNSDSRLLTIIAERNLLNSMEFQTITDALENTIADYGFRDVKIVEGGGAVMNACGVIEYAPAVYFKLPKKRQGGGSSWDFAATTCIFNELELPTSDIFGKPLSLNKHGDTFMNHCGVIFSTEHRLSSAIISIIK